MHDIHSSIIYCCFFSSERRRYLTPYYYYTQFITLCKIRYFFVNLTGLRNPHTMMKTTKCARLPVSKNIAFGHLRRCAWDVFSYVFVLIWSERQNCLFQLCVLLSVNLKLSTVSVSEFFV